MKLATPCSAKNNIPKAKRVLYGAAGGYQKVEIIVSLILQALMAQVMEIFSNAPTKGKKRNRDERTFNKAFFLGEKFR